MAYGWTGCEIWSSTTEEVVSSGRIVRLYFDFRVFLLMMIAMGVRVGVVLLLYHCMKAIMMRRVVYSARLHSTFCLLNHFMPCLSCMCTIDNVFWNDFAYFVNF